MASNLSASLFSPRLNPEKRGGLLTDLIPAIRPDNVDHPFAGALQDIASHNLRQDAWGDVRRMAVTGVGVGGVGAGLMGLVHLLKRNLKAKPHRAPSYLPIPMPAPVDEEERKKAFDKQAVITTKGGLPWYGPAMFFGGLGGLALGWKGVDSILKRRARKEREQELDSARQEFHDALLSQYDKPMSSASMGLAPPQLPKAAADVALGQELDRLFDNVQTALEKRATVGDIMGGAAGGYGIYAGLTGLLTGAMVYNKMKSRSRQAVLEKALKKRERRRFAMQPNEFYAMPEPAAAATSNQGDSGE